MNAQKSGAWVADPGGYFLPGFPDFEETLSFRLDDVACYDRECTFNSR